MNLINKLYPLRNDLELIQTNENGQEIVIIADRQGYSEHQIAVTLEFFWLLSQIGTDTTIKYLMSILGIDDPAFLEPFISELDNLDEMLFLNSPNFQKVKREIDEEFAKNPVRQSVLDGYSHPSEPNEFEPYMDEIFSTLPVDSVISDASAIIVPHLDFVTGENTFKAYSSSYHSIRNTDFDTVVIFGTAHFYASHRFMLSKKIFSSPAGDLHSDIELINEMMSVAPGTFIIDEMAHKPEHSIEIQTTSLRHYFKNKEFKILPVLVAGFFDFMDNNQNPSNDKIINDFIDSLNKSLKKLNRKPVFIASVDFSHYGKKFGDEFQVEEKIPEAIESDKQLINEILNLDADGFYSKIAENEDKWRVCGTAPIYALLKTIPNLKPNLNIYAYWFEKENNSVVSYASISFYQN